MEVSIWYGVCEANPPKPDYYLAYKGPSLGDDETNIGIYYWNGVSWLLNRCSNGSWANVAAWCDISGEAFEQIGAPKQQTSAELLVLEEIREVVERYRIIKALCD